MSKKLNNYILITFLPFLLTGCMSSNKKTWNKELLTLLKEYAPNIDLPYFYFGESYESFFNDAYGAISVSTDYTDDSLIEDATAAFTNNKYDWTITDNSNLDGYPSYTFSVIHHSNNYDVDLYIKNDYSRMDIYCYPYYDDEIKDYLKDVDASLDINFNYYSQNFEEYSYLYTALELVGDISDSKVTTVDGDILNAGDLDYYKQQTVEGTRYDNCVYYANGHEYKINAGYEVPSYDSDYVMNHYLSEYGLLECTWFEDYEGYGEYKNRELGYDIDLWNEYKRFVGAESDSDYFCYLLNIGQTNKFIDNETSLKVIYGDDMFTSVTHNLDGTTTCRIEITIEETWRESFGIYGIANFPGLTKDMDAPFVDEYICEATFDVNNMLTNLKEVETQTILASKVEDENNPWFGKEDYVVYKQINEETTKIINVGDFSGELLFDEPLVATATLGENSIGIYEHIYGTSCTFTADQFATYRFTTTDKRCQLDFFNEFDEYLDSCYTGCQFEITLAAGESISFSAFYLNIGTDFIYIGDINFVIEII